MIKAIRISRNHFDVIHATVEIDHQILEELVRDVIICEEFLLVSPEFDGGYTIIPRREFREKYEYAQDIDPRRFYNIRPR